MRRSPTTIFYAIDCELVSLLQGQISKSLGCKANAADARRLNLSRA